MKLKTQINCDGYIIKVTVKYFVTKKKKVTAKYFKVKIIT